MMTPPARLALLVAATVLLSGTPPAEAAAPAAAATASMGSGSSQAATAAHADMAAIRAETRRWIDAFRAHDLEALMALYEPDAQVALHGQPRLVGRDAIRAFFAPALAGRPDVEFLLDVEDIRVYGDTALLLSKYWYTSQARDGATYRDSGRSLLVYRRDARDRARWRILFDIDQATPDAAFPAPPAAQ